MTRVEDKAIDAWAIYEYREHPKGFYHTCFVDGYKEGYEQAEKDTIRTVKTWLSEIHRVCDITDENGYRVELRNLVASLEKTMEKE